jgi:hypothetical protein
MKLCIVNLTLNYKITQLRANFFLADQIRISGGPKKSADWTVGKTSTNRLIPLTMILLRRRDHSILMQSN